VGRITGVAYASGKTVAYTYNSRGLLATVSDWANGSITFTYDNDGRVISVARSNGVTTQYAYDKDGRTASISEASGSQPLASIALQRDAAGKVTSAARNVPEGPSLAPGAIGFSYDAAEQISGESYDALGRLTNGSVRTYTWDLASELKAYSGSNGSGSFAYDGFGMRTSATEDGTTQDFVWNYALGLPSIATVQSGGADQRYYIYSPGGALLYAIDAAGNVRHWYHFDETGSTTFLTGDTGQVTDSYGITPYGEDVTAAGSTPNPFAWLGQWGVMQEGATGLYYMRARYYDSASARFLTRDPLLSISPRAINPYQYAIANPMRYVDPAGTDEVSVAWEWVKGFWQGVGEGVTVVSNALTFGLDASLSREANEITQNNGSLGTAQKWTAGIGAGAFWAAAGLAVAAETGVTTIGNTVIGGGTTVTATGTATAAGTIAVTQIVSNPEVTTETAQLTEIVFPEVGTETADTVVAVENGSISLSEQLQRAWTQFRDIVAGFPTGVDNRQRLLCAEEQIARDLALPADWVGIEEKELSFCGTSLYAPPEQWQDSYIRFRFPDLFRDTEILPYKLCTGGTELVP
jgi:RHS repeat-associated protein